MVRVPNTVWSSSPLIDDPNQLDLFCRSYLGENEAWTGKEENTTKYTVNEYKTRKLQVEQRMGQADKPSYNYGNFVAEALPVFLMDFVKLGGSALSYFRSPNNEMGQTLRANQWNQIKYELMESGIHMTAMLKSFFSLKPDHSKFMGSLWQTMQGEDIERICKLPLPQQLMFVRLYQMTPQAIASQASAVNFYGSFLQNNHQQDSKPDEFYQRAIELRTLLVSLPDANNVLDVSHQHSRGLPDKRVEINERVNHLIASYDTTLQNPLRPLIGQIRSNVYVNTPQRTEAYFYGPPGVGKTFLVNQLGEALGLPVVNILLDPKTFREQLLGKPITNLQNWLNSPLKIQEIVGELAHAMLETGIVNPILFIDELSDLTGQENSHTLDLLLKLLLDPQLNELKILKDLNATIPFNRATIIFAGNKEITNSAIRSRLSQITFGSLPFSTR